MRKGSRLYVLVVSVLLSPSVAHAASPKEGTIFRMISEQSDGWVLEYLPTAFQSTGIDIDGKQYRAFAKEFSPDSGGVGAPQLPVEILSLGIPFDASVSAELVDPVYELVENQLVAPKPSYRYTDTKDAVAIYARNVTTYKENRFFPAEQVWVEPPFRLRQQNISTIRVSPCQYNPATHVLKRLVKTRVHVRLISGRATLPLLSKTPALRDPQFEEVYRSLLGNYEQAKQWRQQTAGSAARLGDVTREWFETGKTYYRIRISRDGWYRITPSDLVLPGANPPLIDTATVRVYCKGAPVPVFIRPDSAIEFYATSNRGDSTFFDFYTDTSTYWLTWGGTLPSGARFASSLQVGGTAGLDLRSSEITRHFEENTDYYDGTGDVDITQTETVPGEGWVWEYYYPSTTYTHTFVLDTCDTAASQSSVIRVRLFSTTLHYNSPDHRARFWINDSLLGEIAFDGRKEGLFNATFPTSWITNGTNTLKITSVPTASSPNQFYLDWFEVSYHRFNLAVDNQLTFVSPASSGSSPVQITLTGFSDPRIDVFDLTNRRTIQGGTVSGSPALGYAIAFKDTFSSSKKYVAVSSVGQIHIQTLSQKQFTDIRLNPQGADYIIITHKDFLSSAQQLALHRQSTNGVRVKVIDVQDIYDEFNYGILNATKVKDFLRHVYGSWTSPAPAYLLLFGDASWDYHRYLPTTVKTNYVPAYGVPAGDNWFGCFDTTHPFLSSLLIGRIPTENHIQAQRTVAKIISYDSYTLGDWNKNFLFITGGTSPGEQSSFNGISDATILNHVTLPPIGGTPFRVYKSTPNTIDGEHKQELRDLVAKGLVFMNFLGHSGGRIWGVDIGNPNELENTSGMLPFVSSVSCNVGAFAEPSNNVLSEDFVLADNRGAIAMWASSSVGYANIGATLVSYFLSGSRDSAGRGFGMLTTAARIKLWQGRGGDYITIASVNLNPLLGDPLSRLAIPLQADLAASDRDIRLNAPAPGDSVLTLHLDVHNYGLMPADSVGVSVSDLYNGQIRTLVNNRKLRPVAHRDSLNAQLSSISAIGRHSLTMSLDPGNTISEVSKLNNTATTDIYVYANTPLVVRPLNDMVVAPGPQTLVVCPPQGGDSTTIQYAFQLDTVDIFDSPFLIAPGLLSPGPVSAEWTTPSLPDGKVYFWRARSVNAGIFGNWVTSSFSTSQDAPALPAARWRQYSKKQFARATLQQSMAADSGVTIAKNVPVYLYARSLGYRANSDKDYYSILKINEQTIFGLWWVDGNSFMVSRVNEFSGSYEFRAFDVAGQASQADSMAAFINTTQAGNYIAISVILDGQTNVNQGLRLAIKSLGSMLIDSLQPGHSWAFIGRKGVSGPGMTPLEQWSPDGIAADSLLIPNYYSSGNGTITASGIPVALSWDSFHWRYSRMAGTTSIKVALLGVRSNSSVDTLRFLPQDSTDVNLAFLNTITSDTSFTFLKPFALLASNDPVVTPVLREWWMDFEPPPDIALTSKSVGIPGLSIQRGTPLSLPVTLYNIGYRAMDSARVVISLFDRYNALRPIAYSEVGSIPMNGSRSVTFTIPTENLAHRVVLQIAARPAGNSKDLVAGNNTALYSFDVTGSRSAGVQLFADGTQLMDGDYVSAKPQVRIRLPNDPAIPSGQRRVELRVDNTPVTDGTAGLIAQEQSGITSANDDPVFSPQLANGRHDLTVRVIQPNLLGETDTLVSGISVTVLNDYRILQLYNYPNPFSGETYFTFVLTGTRPPDELTIRIFTIAGRKIRQITVPGGALQVGFNRVRWDGRDNDGDEIANGYYLYQVQIKGDDKTESAIEKLVKLR